MDALVQVGLPEDCLSGAQLSDSASLKEAATLLALESREDFELVFGRVLRIAQVQRWPCF
ncbi:MAG TPA: hypothetical protein VMK12_10770 [Anaeromyxobacteraceae bacterium]|nr:hypothetical protein [Anaeromyxobacteraceae bacterium]